MEIIITMPRNTLVPTKKFKCFLTAIDCHILQEERAFVDDNKGLGKIYLNNISLVPRCIPMIFEIDSKDILSVTAKDKKIDQQQSVTVDGTSNLSDNEVDQMVKNAELNAKVDLIAKKAITTLDKGKFYLKKGKKCLTKLNPKKQREFKWINLSKLMQNLLKCQKSIEKYERFFKNIIT